MFKKKLPPIPEATRLDKLTAQDLFLAMEADMMSAGQAMQAYQQRLGDPEASLALLEQYLTSATAIAGALRRKLVVILPNV